jgi:hypothetical protein
MFFFPTVTQTSYLLISYSEAIAGWWFQTLLLFSMIYRIILPIDFYMFQYG